MPPFPLNKRPVRNINGELYIIHAEYQEGRVKNIQLVKEWLGVEFAFRVYKNNTLVFCELIECVKYEEIT